MNYSDHLHHTLNAFPAIIVSRYMRHITAKSLDTQCCFSCLLARLIDVKTINDLPAFLLILSSLILTKKTKPLFNRV